MPTKLLNKIDEKTTSYKIIIGLAILIIGIITFIVPYHHLSTPLIPIFGDFLPSIFAILLVSLVGILAAGLAGGSAVPAVVTVTLVSWSRWRLDQHTPAQAVAGTLLGVLASVAVGALA